MSLSFSFRGEGFFICALMSSGLLLQTILPLIYCFGKGLCADGIDALIRIGNMQICVH